MTDGKGNRRAAAVIPVIRPATGLHDPFTPDHLYLAAHGTEGLNLMDVSSVSIEELATRLMKTLQQHAV